MGQRAVEIIFKHKLLIVLPLLIIMPIMIAIALRPQQKQWWVYTTVWVNQNNALYTDGRLGYTPAANQAALLTDFIRTRSFAGDVLQQTQLAPLLQNPKSEASVDTLFWKSVKAYALSNDFLQIGVTMPDPNLAYKTAQAVNAQFQKKLQTGLDAQTKATLSFYSQVLASTQDALTKAQAQLAGYVAQHPELAAAAKGGSISSLSASDGNLALLTQQVSNDQQGYDNARQNYIGAEQAAAARGEAQPFEFTIVDQPVPPLGPIVSSRLTLLKMPAIGLALGLILAAAIATLLVLTNRAVLDSSDIEAGFDMPVLGEVPELDRQGRFGRRRHRDAVRLRLAGPARRTD